MLKEVLTGIIKKNTSAEVFDWLKEKSTATAASFNTAFVILPRKTGKKIIKLTEEEKQTAQLEGLYINNWTIDRLSRVWLLMHLDSSDKEKYFSNIENLFFTGEMNELIALYSSLPVLCYPELWKKRCAEGIRNNIADVLESIMCNNIYPSQHLDEPAWNQLVLKAFFTEKPIDQIIGLDKRANEKLASTAYDFAKERLAAHRKVDPQLWRCIEPFANENKFPDINKIKDYVLQQ
jgi:predicted DNA-binding protein (MmcQ/YjbR family)